MNAPRGVGLFGNRSHSRLRRQREALFTVSLSRDTRGMCGTPSITLLRRASLASNAVSAVNTRKSRRLAETPFSRAYFFSENSQALRDTSSRREPTIGPTESRNDVALNAWTVPPWTHGLAPRGCGSALEQHNKPRSVTRSDRKPISRGRLRICAPPTSTALPKRNPQWLRRTNKVCLPYPARLSRGTARLCPNGCKETV